MFFSDVLVALAVAVVLLAVFGLAFRKLGPWPGIFGFLLLVFLAAWAGGVWITPFGPSLWGAVVLPFLLAGLLFALLLAALTPPRREEEVKLVQAGEEVEPREPSPALALGIFFWMVVAVLIIAIVLRYTYPVVPTT